ncbi:MAG: PQQ-binding-like beta-propeller repeat protein [Planctomycetota bacterium]|nr:PQQ-binding-like beta-propeller repeat protein [Planctomycetota bacterium]
MKWSATENIAWRADLPGPGSSSPITVGNRVFITCYSGYGVADPIGDQKDLKRHLLCFNRATGDLLWKKQFDPKLPEHAYQGEGAYHGYAASTPVSDGERLYVFFGKSGVLCFTLDGEQLWQSFVGEGTHGWGSGTSPVLYKNSLIINASVESGSLIAFDKLSGQELWKAKEIRSSWNTPLLVEGKDRTELVVNVEGRVLSFAPADGAPLWNADGVHRYVCPSVVSHGDMIYAIGGGHTSLAVRMGGKDDVTATHEIWKKTKGSNVGSPSSAARMRRRARLSIRSDWNRVRERSGRHPFWRMESCIS